MAGGWVGGLILVGWLVGGFVDGHEVGGVPGGFVGRVKVGLEGGRVGLMRSAPLTENPGLRRPYPPCACCGSLH